MATVSFPFVHQVGSTAQLRALGDAAAAPVRRSPIGLIQTARSQHGVQQVDDTGDVVMGTFSGSSEAVACAVAIHEAGRRRNRRERPERRV